MVFLLEFQEEDYILFCVCCVLACGHLGNITLCTEPADVPPGQNTTTEVPEDGWKYFQAKCDGLSGNVIISIHDIVGKTNIYASATVGNVVSLTDIHISICVMKIIIICSAYQTLQTIV